MFHVILVNPEIPPNTGNVIRLCANVGAQLHLVQPLGFELDDVKLRRAGLDYHEWQPLHIHQSLAQALAHSQTPLERCFALTTHASKNIGEFVFQPDDVFVFGRETAGLSISDRALFQPTQCMRLPMQPKQRSLNLSNAVAITLFEAWRQIGYIGGI